MKLISILAYNYTSIKMQGKCEFERPDYEYEDYDYDYIDDYVEDYDEYDNKYDFEVQCLNWCEEKAKLLSRAVGCYFASAEGFSRRFSKASVDSHTCVFIKTGVIVEKSANDSDIEEDQHVCWKFLKPFSQLVLSTFSVFKNQICQGSIFDGTFDEAVEICDGPGKDFCKGIHDKDCDGQIIKICTELEPADSSDSTRNGCTYVKKGIQRLTFNLRKIHT